MALPRNDPLLGKTIAGRLELLELLGTGAMGKVYRAKHLGLDKEVAIKVLQSQMLEGAMPARRFKAEARAASRLDHPNSVSVFDFGEDEGLLYLAMEYLRGHDLQVILRESKRLDNHRSARIMAQVASALAAAHDAGVIHRDIKPGNIMLVDRETEDGITRDFVKVCDFGLAKILDPGPEASQGPLTRQGAVFGTPAYMSPEQAQGLLVDARTDLYSCGAVLYKMLAGHSPFRAESATVVLLKHIQDPVPSLRDTVPGVDPRLERIVRRCLEKAPSDRFGSARALRDALQEVIDDPDHRALSQDRNSARPALGAGAESGSAAEAAGGRANEQAARAPSTVHPEALDPTLLMTVSSDAAEPPAPEETARLMATFAPVDMTLEASREVEPRSPGAPLWTWIPGALALLLAGALLVYLVLGPR